MNKRLSELISPKSKREWYGGRRCGVCTHKRRQELDKDLLDVVDAKRRGSAVPWAYLYRTHFKPEYKLQWTRVDSLLAHISNCLGIKK